MDDQEKNQTSRSYRGTKSGLWLIFISIFLLMSSVILVIIFIYTFFVPANPLNPFPPVETTAHEVAAEPEPTQTPTSTPLPPTQTPKPFPDVVPTLDAGILFEVQSGMPWYLPHQSGCRYMYVAGNILDLDEGPTAGYTVRLSGVIGDQTEMIFEVISGSALQYSAGGFEIQIGEMEPISTQNEFYLQLFKEDGTAASPMISFCTSENCSQNLIYINFVQVRD